MCYVDLYDHRRLSPATDALVREARVAADGEISDEGGAVAGQDEAHPDLKEIRQSLPGLDPPEKKRLAAATVREAGDDFRGEVAAAALQAVPMRKRRSSSPRRCERSRTR